MAIFIILLLLYSYRDDGDDRHWIVSSRHVGNCREDEGWIQVIDKPKPGRDRCVCSYENVEKYPAIMYAKGNRKTRWADRSKLIHIQNKKTYLGALRFGSALYA